MTDLMKTLGITIPIIQAPMAGVSTPALAAAVSNAGTLGSLGVGAMSVEAMRAAIQETRALTTRPFNVNVFCHTSPAPDPACDAAWLAYLAPLFTRFGAAAPTALHEIYISFNDNKAMLTALLEERPAVVSFHFGLPPAESVAALREAGIVLLASATSLDEARLVEQAGIDAVIAQGIEAGGHRGLFDPEAVDEELSTLALTRLLVRETALPVIAAGGIMDGAGIAAALDAGAQAAQLGTAFITCPESAADASYRAALLGSKADSTAMTSAISGRPARGIANGFTALGTAPDHPPIPPYPRAYDAGKALQIAARAAGDTDFVVQLAGQAAHRARALPAADLVAQLQAECADRRRLHAAEAIVAARYGVTGRLSREEVLREKYRNHVLRCVVHDGPADAPHSVIIKTVEGEGESAYDPTNDTNGGTAWRFYNEWAGNRFLDALDLETPLSAGLIGGDRAAGLIVLQDLGKEGKSLADHMQGTSHAELESARVHYAASIGRLHAVTIGKEELFMEIRREIGGTETVRAGESSWRSGESEGVKAFQALCKTVGATLPEGFDAEVDQVDKAINDPSLFRVFSPGDSCPDNHRLTESGYARFFDFEFAGFTHALLAAAYFYLPFPTCWCVNRLPDAMVAQMEAAYRSELAVGCPEALDDAIFYPALLAACAFWTINTLSWGWEGMLEKDNTWGISTVRQRHLLRLSNFTAMAQQHNIFPAIAEAARLLRNALSERFPQQEEMPLYPPFREIIGG